MYLIYISCCWLAGIFTGSRIDLPLVAVFSAAVPFLFIPVFRKRTKILLLTGLCMVAFFSGSLHYGTGLPENDDAHLRFYNDAGKVQLKGMVENDPEETDKNTRLRFRVDSICLGENWSDISGTVLVFVPVYSEYRYGDLLLIEGLPETAPRWEDFDYEAYLARKGIYSTMYYPEITVLETGKGIRPMEWIYSFRNNIANVIDKTLPEPRASLTRAILLGMRSSIPESVKDEFSYSGTAHLLAISGLHLSIIAAIMITLGVRIFGRRGYIYIWTTLAAIWMYAVLTGMNPPVLRSVQMISLFLAAEFFGRQRSAVIALVFAAALMAGLNPRVLWDPSFQMSFAAMAGLVFMFPPVQSLSRRLIHSRFGGNGTRAGIAVSFSDSLAVSFSTIAAVWPLIAFYFGIVSPVGPVATFFALPALPWIILCGILGGVTGLFFLPAAHVIAWFGWLPASYILLVAKFFSLVPHIESGSVNILFIVFYYIALVIVLRFVHAKRRPAEIFIPSIGVLAHVPKKYVVIPLVVLTALVYSFVLSMPDGKLQVCFLDVGQGDAILVQKGSRQILIDGGPDPRSVTSALGERMPFWDRNIDAVILTHPDADHITGLIEVLNRFEVGTVLYPEINNDSILYRRFTGLIDEKEINAFCVGSGDRIGIGNDIFLDVLNPAGVSDGDDIDNRSMVIHLKSGAVSFLLTGDIMQEAEYRLLSGRIVSKAIVLKLAHHGSSSSSTPAFLDTVNPVIAVISAGKDNRYGHPDEEVLSRLDSQGITGVYRTDIHGTIVFITDGENLRVKTGK